MIRIGTRNVRDHFGRFLLSVIAVVLGVTFLIATFTFRAVMENETGKAFQNNFHADIYVEADDNFSGVPLSLIDDLKKINGVKEVVPTISANVLLIGKDDKPVKSGNTEGTKAIATLLDADKSKILTTSGNGALVKGKWPSTDKQIVLNKQMADLSHYKVGDKPLIITKDGRWNFEVSGIFKIPNDALNNYLIGFEENYARAHFISNDLTSAIAITVDKKNEIAATKDAITNELKQAQVTKVSINTGEKLRADFEDTVNSSLGFVQSFLMVFAVIALFVGTFIIGNTFSMIVREETRTYALLRAVGASPKQVAMTIFSSAFIVGLIGSGIGIVVSFGLNNLLFFILDKMGSTLSASPFPSVDTMIIAIIVGVVVSLLSSLLPARRAANTPTIQAMNATTVSEKSVIPRGILGTILLLLGTGLLYIGRTDFFTTGIGCFFIVIGVLVFAPVLVKPLGFLLTLPFRFLRPMGYLAKQNTARLKRKTANTASALFIGMALVTICTILASSAMVSSKEIIQTMFKSDFMAVTFGDFPISQEAIDEMSKVNGVKTVDPLTMAPSSIMSVEEFNNKQAEMLKQQAIQGQATQQTQNSTTPTDIRIFVTFPSNVFDKDLTIDSFKGKKPAQAFADNELVIGESMSSTYKQKIGDELIINGKEKVKIGSIVDSSILGFMYMAPQKIFEKSTMPNNRRIMRVFINGESNANLTKVKQDLENAVKNYYVITINDQNDLISLANSILQIVVNILYGLLLLSILIAILGIINTMALAVIERTREIGLMRAIGLGKTQLAVTLGIESVVISVFGGILGTIVGIVLGASIQNVLSDVGLKHLNIPWSSIIIWLLGTFVVGVLACIFPARRALKLPILQAIETDD